MKSLRMLLLTYNMEGGCFSDFLRSIQEGYDILIFAFQECCESIPEAYCYSSKQVIIDRIFDHLTTISNDYLLKFEVSMNAECVICFATEKVEMSCFRHEKLKMGVYGANKGAIIASFCIFNSPICIIACHFEAGESDEKLQKRVYMLRNALQCSRNGKICSHEIKYDARTYILGDLNFRLSLNPDVGKQLAEDERIDELLKRDQLREQFDNVKDILPISFLPTFKYEQPNVYSTAKCCSYVDRICELQQQLSGEMLCSVKNYGGVGCANTCQYVASAYNSLQYWESDHQPVMGEVTMNYSE